MADDVTLGELIRGQARLEAAQQAMAREMLPAKSFEFERAAMRDQFAAHERTADENRARMERQIDELRATHEADIKALRGELKAAEERRVKRSQFTRTQAIGIATVIATVLAAVIAAWIGALSSAKGLK